MKFIASRSFYGDVGSIRRNQAIVVTDSRMAKELQKKGLIRPMAAADDAAKSKGKLSTKAE